RGIVHRQSTPPASRMCSTRPFVLRPTQRIQRAEDERKTELTRSHFATAVPSSQTTTRITTGRLHSGTPDLPPDRPSAAGQRASNRVDKTDVSVESNCPNQTWSTRSRNRAQT